MLAEEEGGSRGEIAGPKCESGVNPSRACVPHAGSVAGAQGDARRANPIMTLESLSDARANRTSREVADLHDLPWLQCR